MNGLEALNNIRATYRIHDRQGNNIDPVQFEYSVIEKDLKVLNLLKEKKVDLDYINNYITTSDFIYGHLTIEILTEDYYNTQDGYIKLTEEEMQLIVDWLKEKK